VVLAIVTAVIDAGGANRVTTAQAALGAYRPALVLITGVSALGAVVALSGLCPPVFLSGRRHASAAAARDE
jgi:hypothetical protein